MCFSLQSSSLAFSCRPLRDPKLPFSKWNTEQVCDWLEEIGIGQYGILARHWVTSGQTLLTATSQDLERVRTHLHLLTLPKIILSDVSQFYLSDHCRHLSVRLAFSDACLRRSTCSLVSPSALVYLILRTSLSVSTGSF